MYTLLMSKQAEQDYIYACRVGLKDKIQKILHIMGSNPYVMPPPYEKLNGNLRGCYSRRLNIKHRLVYEVFEKEKTIRILRMWSHYD
jgi:toxin YoeB